MLFFLAGVIVMSIIITIGIALSNIDNMTPLYICAGPVFWIVVAIVFVVKKFLDFSKINKYKALILCPDGKIRYCNSKDAQYLIDYDGDKYIFADFSSLNKSAELWDIKYRGFNKNIGNMRYCPKTVWSEYPEISKDIIRIVKKEI